MKKLEQLRKLNRWLLDEMPDYKNQAVRFPETEQGQWQLFRSLVNVRKPYPVSSDFIKIQDTFLKNEIAEKGITDIAQLSPIKDKIYLWQGDITTLRVDAIVNAANSGMTGCYCPCHGCIDNAIHTYAGVQLRMECAELMRKQGCPEPVGQAKITKAYNLPCKYIIHTVGPMVDGRLTEEHRRKLLSCYRACLETAERNNIGSIAFCCISTGEFHFPNQEAAKIAVREVQAFIRKSKNPIKIVFNSFHSNDSIIYKNLLK